MKIQEKSYLEERFEQIIASYRLPEPIREFVFMGYRFDFVWLDLMIAVEIDGGTYIGGDHVRGDGYRRDCRKNNLAQIEGWSILRADAKMLEESEFPLQVRKMIIRRITWKQTGKLPYWNTRSR